MSTYNDLVSEAVLSHLRETSGSQQTIAKALGVSQAAVSKKLKGRRHWSLDNLDRLHRTLGIEVPLPAMTRPSKEIVQTRPAPVAVTQ